MYVHELLLFGSREGVRERENVSERIRERKREQRSNVKVKGIKQPVIADRNYTN